VVTGGIIGGFIAGKIDQSVGIVLFIAAILFAGIGYYTIPKDKREGQ